MKRWFASKLRGLVSRLATPITDRVDAVARETRNLHAALMETEARLASLQDQAIDTATRDLGVVVRMLAAIEARAAEGQVFRQIDPEGPPPQAGADPARDAPRYAIYLGAGPDPSDRPQDAALLRTLRHGLDRLDDAADGQPELWIEHRPIRGQASELLPPESYSRMMRGGTGFIEVLRPVDALAIGQALDRNGRADVQVVFRCLGMAEGHSVVFRDALSRADHRIFSSQTACAAAREACGTPDGPPPQDHIHALPDPATTDPVALARSYRASAAAVIRASRMHPRDEG